ncbi:hypothetical protein ABZ714_10190 [Streptomyces sp. NPDC006798]|uniref:hypothetical protein n=1 Tax=Streptomyces sp. NPDC006798 TaxID=3155462 RepID=UPI0033FFCBDF
MTAEPTTATITPLMVMTTPHADLYAALRALGEMIPLTLGEITAGETELVLNLLAQRERRVILQNLKFRKVEPRRFGRVLSEQVLKRVQRLEPAREQAEAARWLTQRIRQEIEEAAAGGDGQHPPGDPVERWGVRLARLTLFAWADGSRQTARAVLWAADRDWLGVRAEPEALEAVRAAAERVAETSGDEPGFACPHAAAGSLAGPPDYAVAAVPGRPGDAAGERPEEPENLPDPPDLPCPPDPGRSAVSGREQDLAELAARTDVLTTAVPEASAAAERIRTALADGRPPAGPDLALLARVNPAFDGVVETLAALGATGVPARLDDIVRAVADHCAAVRRDAETRTALAAVAAFTCPRGGPVADVLEPAVARAAALLAEDDWSEADHAAAEALTLIGALVRAGADGGTPAEIQELQRRLTRAHPPYAVVAVFHDQIAPGTGTAVPARLPARGGRDESAEPSESPPSPPAPDRPGDGCTGGTGAVTPATAPGDPRRRRRKTATRSAEEPDHRPGRADESTGPAGSEAAGAPSRSGAGRDHPPAPATGGPAGSGGTPCRTGDASAPAANGRAVSPRSPDATGTGGGVIRSGTESAAPSGPGRVPESGSAEPPTAVSRGGPLPPGSGRGPGRTDDVPEVPPPGPALPSRSGDGAGPVAECLPRPGAGTKLIATLSAESLSDPGPGVGIPPGPAVSRPPSTPAGGETGPGSVEIGLVLARLVVEERYGLAARLSAAARRRPSEVAALRLAGLGGVLRNRSDSAADAIAELLRDGDVLAAPDNNSPDGPDGPDSSEADVSPLLVLPALVNAAVVTGEPVVGAQLKALAQRLSGALAEVAAELAEPALTGALLIAPLDAVGADVSGQEQRLEEAVEACRTALAVPRMRFQRATQMARRLLAPTGEFGRVLGAVVNGAPEAAEHADDLLEGLGRPAQIEAAVDRMDGELRSPGGRTIQGAARADVRQFMERVRDAVRRWRAAERETRTRESAGNAWAYEAVAGLRRRMLGLRDRITDDLAAQERRTADPLTRAAANRAAVVFTRVLDELAEPGRKPPHPPTGTEADAGAVLDAELLKVPPRTGPAGTGAGAPTVAELLTAVDTSWDRAVELLLSRDGFTAVHTVLRLADAGALPAAHGLTPAVADRPRIERREHERRTALAAIAARQAADLRRAQADGALTVEQDVGLQELLADAAPATPAGEAREPAAIRRNLDRVAELLPRYRAEAADRLRARLDGLTGVGAADRDHIRRHLDADSLATAAELLYYLELGEPVPEIRSEESHLEVFYPAVPDGLPGGITEQLVTTVRTGGRHRSVAALDYTALSTEEAARAAAALGRWRKLATTKDRGRINPREDLSPALGLLGYESKGIRPLDGLPRGKDYKFFDIVDVQVTGRAWAPAFGSGLAARGDKLRALLIWGRPAADLLLSRIRQDPSDASLLVVHFGTLDSRTRAELAARSRDTAKPVVVVDDAALAYLAARGNRRVDAATETLLPFSAVNPYIKEKRGQIGREMFYGRDRERKSIIDPAGTQILYGGRGLGKSALLADAGDHFERQLPGCHRTLHLNLDKIGIGKATALGAAAIWTTLDRELTRMEVLDEPRRRGPRREAWERVTEGVQGWLDRDPERRLLILLDECDLFFEADVPECIETRRLRGLGEDSRGRAKVVFAGLHSVQRFTRLARNGPFGHLAQTPAVVGPLSPQFAADLLVHPLRALGFEFADADLVNRVLGFCSYQPFLLQIFGSRLVEGMQRKRARRAAAGPPYAIDAADVDAVEQDASLRSDITAAFKETLELDHRYLVVANVLARHARESGLETRLSDHELRDECGQWWREGFERLDSEGFRAYLLEMVGLGVLAPNNDGRGWHLRGPNALRMIGTAQEIEARLEGAERDCRLEETLVRESRPDLADGRSAPLTVDQIDYLLGDGGNQVRVVLGSPATGVGDVVRTLRGATGRIEGWTAPEIGSAHAYREALADGVRGERRLVVSDLTGKRAKPCRESLAMARTTAPDRPDATRSVVLVSGTRQLAFWRELLTGDRTADGDGTVVTLRRYDAGALKDWSRRQSFCETDDRLARLAELTGGWPLLLDRALELRRNGHDQDTVLGELARTTAREDGAGELAEATGILRDEAVYAGYRMVVAQLGTGWNRRDDVGAAVELAVGSGGDARWVLVCLETLQVFDRDGGDRLRVESVLHRALEALELSRSVPDADADADAGAESGVEVEVEADA